MVNSAEGTKALALELCREFEDKFLEHLTTGEVSLGVGKRMKANDTLIVYNHDNARVLLEVFL